MELAERGVQLSMIYALVDDVAVLEADLDRKSVV